METYHKKSKIGRGNRFFRGLSKRTNHRFLQTRETVPLSKEECEKREAGSLWMRKDVRGEMLYMRMRKVLSGDILDEEKYKGEKGRMHLDEKECERVHALRQDEEGCKGRESESPQMRKDVRERMLHVQMRNYVKGDMPYVRMWRNVRIKRSKASG